MHPACPNKKQNHLQNSLLQRTPFRKTSQNRLRSKGPPLFALPVAISHKASLKPMGCTSVSAALPLQHATAAVEKHSHHLSKNKIISISKFSSNALIAQIPTTSIQTVDKNSWQLLKIKRIMQKILGKPSQNLLILI